MNIRTWNRHWKSSYVSLEVIFNTKYQYLMSNERFLKVNYLRLKNCITNWHTFMDCDVGCEAVLSRMW